MNHVSWASSALEGSLNPASIPQLPPAIVQVNYFGGRDQNVPPSVLQSFGRHHPEATLIEIANFDHVCCWIERWPELLDAAASAPLTDRRPRD